MIVKGYKGVMDLDLSLVPKEYHKIAVDQHYKDIRDYKIYQKTLKPKDRYENTVERINRILEKEDKMRKIKLEKEQREHYELCNKLYNLTKKNE